VDKYFPLAVYLGCGESRQGTARGNFKRQNPNLKENPNIKNQAGVARGTVR
jgi:hypothetical protein